MHHSHPSLSLPYWFQWMISGVFLGYIVWKYIGAKQHYPQYQKSDVVYQEWFASGASQKNILTKLGGARNCLRLIVTNEFLLVTSWPLLTIFAAVYDLFHIIPIHSINEIVRSRYFGIDTLLLTYTDDSGNSHTLRLLPKYIDKFLQSMKVESK
jgi:hypothetical protein